jgi:hypothetical protein
MIALFCIIYIGSCAPPTLYYWGNYEGYLYEMNMKSDPEGAFNILSEAVNHVENKEGIKLAPGLYAEYGFMLYQKGRIDEAAHYFRKESEAFPESSPLMNKLIVRIEEPGVDNSDGQPSAESNPEMTSESVAATPGGEE